MGHFVNSCKMAGNLGEEEMCGVKIRLIFRGAESDKFIDDFDSLDMSGMGFRLERSNIDLTVKEKIEDLGEVHSKKDSPFNGYIYELRKEYEVGQYILEILNNKEKKSLFFIKSAYIDCKASTNMKNIVTNRKAITIPKTIFSTRYIVDEYLNIVIELALNIRINCDMEGASEPIIYKKDNSKKSLVVPLDYGNIKEYLDGEVEKDELQGFYNVASRDYPNVDDTNLIIERKSPNFKDFFSKDDGSIGFKVVNYRKDIYTGNDENILQGGDLSMNVATGLVADVGSLISDKLARKIVPFTTGVETEFFHTEFIENKVFVMLESGGKNYLFHQSGNFEFLDNVKELKDLKISEEQKVYHIDHKSIQLIFIHLKFDGKKLEHKDAIIDSIKFDDKGTPKS